MKFHSQKVVGGPLDEDLSVTSFNSTSTASSRRRRTLRKNSNGKPMLQSKASGSSTTTTTTAASSSSNGSYQSVPDLRRAGSSMISYSESSMLDMDDDYDESTILSDTIPELTSAGSIFYRTITTQTEAIFMNFYWNGLPWEGYQCRSARAGLTGSFFALPVLFCKDNRYEQAWWILQAFSSVLADYCYIHTRSFWHGFDRIVAQLSLLMLVVRAFFFVKWWAVLFLVSLPVSCFALATRAKDDNALERWHWCHCLWHIVAPIGCMVGVFLSYNCPHDAVDNAILKEFCRASNPTAAAWFGV